MPRWTIGLQRDGRWLAPPVVAENTWLEQGRLAAADMLYAVGGSYAFSPYNIIEIGTADAAPDRTQTGCLSPLAPRLMAQAVMRDSNLVTVRADFPAQDYLGEEIAEAALYNVLQGGAALYRVVMPTRVPVGVGGSTVVAVVIAIDLFNQGAG
jgi:hypothetical protein